MQRASPHGEEQTTVANAILAYGSLIEDPGTELAPLIADRIPNVQTPFSIEFARSSGTRGGAPTLVPVDVGGARVNGVLLVLNAGIDRTRAEDLLWRRETRNEKSTKHYRRPTKPGPNSVLVECVHDLAGIEVVLFTKVPPNIRALTAEHLADLAIQSARGEAGATETDGISYLVSAVRQGIETPLSPEYMAMILRKVGAADLKTAHEMIRTGDVRA